MSNPPPRQLLLLDASGWLYRAWHALPRLSNSRGEGTGALLGFINMLRRLFAAERPDYAAAVFDAGGQTFRHRLYPDYKAQRPPMPDELRGQIEPLQAVVRALGLPLLSVPDVEADDVIGTLATQADAAGLRTLIATGDKDMAQLVNERIALFDGLRDIRLDREGVLAKFGVPPERIVDYLSLMGDSSDNIPGVPGCGPKTAVKWLSQYGDLDGVAAAAPRIGGRIGETLRAALPQLPLARELATIRRDVSLPLAPDQLLPQAPDLAALRHWYERFESPRLLATLDGPDPLRARDSRAARAGAPATSAATSTREDPATAILADALEDGAPLARRADPGGPAVIHGPGARDNALPGSETADGDPAGNLFQHVNSAKTPDQAIIQTARSGTTDSGPTSDLFQHVNGAKPPDHAIILDWETLEDWIARLEAADLFALDTETTSLNTLHAELVGLSFAVAPGQAAYLPLAHRDPDAPPQLDRARALARLKPLLEDPRPRKVGQNLKYDLGVLAQYDIALRGIAHDTMLESYVLDSTATRHDLDSLAKKYLGHDCIGFADIAGKGAKQIGFDQVPVPVAARYAAEDAEVALRLHQVFWPRLSALPEVARVYTEIEIPLIPVLSRMERAGVRIDRARLAEHSQELAHRLLELERQAWEAAGHPFNLGSPKQIGAILFEELGLPVVAKTPGGAPSTAESVLEQLAADPDERNHRLPRLILEHRGLAKLKSTYTDRLPEMIDPATGRVHTSYHQAVAATGRLSSSDPNLQNIPIRTEEGRRIRRAFVAESGHRLLAADYSQIELRILAHLSGDERLLAAFAAGQDIHRATAAEILGLAPEDVTADQRRAAKAVNFGLIYGMSAFGLARQLGIERGAAQDYMNRYFQRYPGVQDFMEDIRQRARRDRHVETLFGRRLHLPDIAHGNQAKRAAAERTAINAPMQGTAADIVKRAMLAVDAWIQAERPPARLLMQVHDELVLEVAADATEAVGARVRAAMESAASLRVPLIVDIGAGANWDEAH